MGSIRIPAACCGLVGFKPGSGLVPAELGVSAWYGMAENGPMATTVEDAALMLSVLAGRSDFRTPGHPDRPLRIAVSTRAPLAGVRVDPEIVRAALDTGAVLAAAGHHVEHTDPPGASARSAVSILARWFAGVAQDAASLQKGMLERRTRRHARLGKAAQWLRLVRPEDRANWQRRHEPFFRRFDVLITPVLAATPPRADSWSRRSWTASVWADARLAPFTPAWNFAGYPAAAVPAGMHSDGTPLSVQLVAYAGGEPIVLSIASQIQSLRPWPRHVLSASTT